MTTSTDKTYITKNYIADMDKLIRQNCSKYNGLNVLAKEFLPSKNEDIVIENIYDDILQKKYENLDWEVLLPRKLKYEFETVDHLGITQNIGVWDDKSRI